MSKAKPQARFRMLNLAAWLNLPLALFAVLIIALQASATQSVSAFSVFGIKPLAWFVPVERFFGSSYENPIRSLLPTVLSLLLYPVGYLCSFNRRATVRPSKRVLMLHFEAASVVAALVLAALELAPFELFGGLLAAVIFLVWPAAAWYSERGVARILEMLSRFFFTHDRFALANTLMSVSALLEPGDVNQLRALGVLRSETGDVVGAIQTLEPLVTEDCADIKLLEVIEECYRTEREWEKALRVEKKLLNLCPEMEEPRMRAARVLEELDRIEDAIRVLEEGLPTQRLEFEELLLAFHLKAQRVGAALETVRRMEDLDPPRGAARAEQAYRRILEGYPDHKETMERLAKLLMRRQKAGEAHELFERVVALDSHRHDLRARLVQYYQEKEQLDKAEPHLMALMDAGSASEDIVLLYGNILIHREEYDRALMHFQYAVEQFPEDYRFAFFLAQISFKTESFEEARRWCDQARALAKNEHDTNRIDFLRDRIEQSVISRELQVLHERSRRDPENVEMRLNLLQSLCAHGMADKAVGEYDALLTEMPELRGRVIKQLEAFTSGRHQNFRLMDYLADLKTLEGCWDEAFELARKLAERSLHKESILIERCQRILRQAPDHIPSLQCLGEIYRKEEKWEEVINIYQHLLDLAAPNASKIREALFEACMRLNREDKAAEIARALLEESPYDLNLRLQLARLYASQNRFEEAFEHLQIAQSQDYYNAEVVKLMQSLKARRKTHRLQVLLETIEKDPSNAPAQMEAGDMYQELGETKKAIACYQRVMQNRDLKNRAGVKLAYAMAQLRMFDLAEETLEDINLRSDDPSEETLLKSYCYETAEAFRHEAMHDRALKIYKKIFRVDASFRDVVDRIETLSD